ncbi:AIM24 family protein [Pseudokineococcus basanitobsidens]|uniref:AIM24 family protein n=1 Tax=Pseudokineococcus basanitobsidens TaxID=1926649 RepID=A0ABU8RII4_9ACTN
MRSHLFSPATAEQQTGERWVRQNEKMLRVVLGPDVLAAKGSMVAFQGDVRFEHEGAGSVGRLVRRLASSADTPLMRCSGQGEVFFARRAEDVFTVELEGDAVVVDGANVLAFDADLDWDVRRVQGAGTLTGGPFTLEISGRGTVALTSDGPPVLLDCSQQPTSVDLQAAVAWSAGLAPQLRSSMSARSMLRGGSGEAFQYVFSGPGFVVVQPSEGRPAPAGGHGGGGGLGDLLG